MHGVGDDLERVVRVLEGRCHGQLEQSAGREDGEGSLLGIEGRLVREHVRAEVVVPDRQVEVGQLTVAGQVELDDHRLEGEEGVVVLNVEPGSALDVAVDHQVRGRIEFVRERGVER